MTSEFRDLVRRSPTAREFTLEVGPITRTQIVRFAAAGGDFNPMHHDEPFAQSAGQPGVFAMGQLLAALFGRMAVGWVGREQLRALSVRFTAKVWPGDVLTLAGRVHEEIATPGGGIDWICQLSATRADGEVVGKGLLTVAVAAAGSGP